MAGYVLTRAAAQDLAGIWDHTFKTWSADQADRYLEKLEICCRQIETGQAVCRSFADIDPRLHSHHCERHYIFFLTMDDGPVVIAILHERMDLLVHLLERLV